MTSTLTRERDSDTLDALDEQKTNSLSLSCTLPSSLLGNALARHAPRISVPHVRHCFRPLVAVLIWHFGNLLFWALAHVAFSSDWS